jgi:XTP/dITP diphosphohydrolase
MRIVFVTSNEHKAREAQEILGTAVEPVALDVPEIQALDLEEVAQIKAEAAYELLGSPEHPVLVEDSGLVVESWNGLPGALTKWFVKSLGNEGILKMHAAYPDRSARAVCVVAVAVGGPVHTFRGEVRGHLAPEPRGTEGFGWDPIFVPAGETRTYAELGALKHRDSHRARAFRAAREWLAGPNRP